MSRLQKVSRVCGERELARAVVSRQMGYSIMQLFTKYSNVNLQVMTLGTQLNASTE